MIPDPDTVTTAADPTPGGSRGPASGHDSRHGRAMTAAAVYVVLALVPLLLAVLPPRPGGRPFWTELSIALGGIGLGQMALQFALIARFRIISEPFGIDLVMRAHRHLGVIATAMILGHVVVLGWQDPSLWQRMLPMGGGGAALGTGTGALAALLVLALLSYARRAFHLGYEAWRVTHALLGVAALVLAVVHVRVLGSYLGAAWKSGALTLWCAVLVGFLVVLRGIKPWIMAQHPWSVASVTADVRGCWSLALKPTGHPGLRFAPGQFAWLKVGVSPWSVREHPLSFSSSAEHGERLEFGIKAAGDFTQTVGDLVPGTQVYLDGPHGSFSCDFHPTPGYVFVAGGIGITPILSMLRTLADRDNRDAHVLVYACNRWDRVVFRQDIDALKSRLNLTVILVLEQGHPGWMGPVGYVSAAILNEALGADPNLRQVFVCGPDAMMNAVEGLLLQCGVSSARITLERFNLV